MNHINFIKNNINKFYNIIRQSQSNIIENYKKMILGIVKDFINLWSPKQNTAGLVPADKCVLN